MNGATHSTNGQEEGIVDFSGKGLKLDNEAAGGLKLNIIPSFRI